MKAAVLQNKQVMTYGDEPDPAVEAGQVLLKVRAASICGSDISRFAKGHRMYPLILGHEVAGEIVAVGEGVPADLVGKQASVIPLVPCFNCQQCQRGLYSACSSYSFIGSRQSGGFADYVAIPARNALIVPDGMKAEEAALIEPSTVARHILDLGDFQAGQTALVLGAGSIGLMVVQWLRILGAKTIIATDTVEANLEIARKVGAHAALNPKNTDVIAAVKALTGDGVDLSVEAAGSPQALAQTIPATRPRGTIVLGGNQPLDASLPMQFVEDLMRKELTLRGCFMSYSAPFPGHEWTDTVEAIENGTLDLQTMISHREPLAEVVGIFERIARHELAHQKIILLP